jgi:hypothetical protein
MQLSESLRLFMHAHAADDLSALLLSASRYPEVDIPFVAEQISARRQIRDKLPAWYADDRILFPSKIAAEQCSSEQTALYKQRLLREEKHLCDLTGGLGVDAYYFAQKLERVTYVERSKACFEAAMHNFSVLRADTITGCHATAEDWLAESGAADVFYLDPARRRAGNTRVFALADCEPDLLTLLPALLRRAPKVIVKLSPMLDLRHTLALLPETVEVHVVSVKNECKELLFVLTPEKSPPEPLIYCANYTTTGAEQLFRFRLSDEPDCVVPFAPSVGTYLYEPNASILKAGAYKQIAVQMNLNKLHASSHLYTSDRLTEDFPGRVFTVEEILPFRGKLCRTIARHIPFANLSTRNFPLSVAELRRRTRIADGGDVFLFATTLADEQKVLIRCRKALPASL